MSVLGSYVNILTDRFKSSDFMWVSRDFVPSKSNLNATNKTDYIRIHQDVLKSPRIQKLIKEISTEENIPQQAVAQRVTSTLKEIGYSNQLPVIRCMAYFLVKILKKTLNGIFVNEAHLKKIKAQMSHNPIIFLPSHRSYADFILMAYVAFHYDIVLPCVAAGMDFHSMWLMGQMLRDTHAFFMRRSFADDKLYRSVFDEYVQTLVICGDYPVEFFIEGTRSRSAKPLPPKFGMLAMVLTPLLEHHVSDITIVPVNLSYDRTMEESLFAFELLGSPKPKETTSGLIKAIRVLDEKYGNIYVNFCEPFSAKEFLKSLPASASPVVDLAFSVITRQQQNCVLSCFNVISLVLTNHIIVHEDPLLLSEVVNDVSWLQSILQELSANVIFSQEDVLESLKEAIQIHKSLVKLSPDGILHLVFSDLPSAPKNNLKLKGHRLKDETMSLAVPLFMLQHYVNPCLYFLVNMAFVTIILRSVSDITCFARDDVFEKYQFLRSIFTPEFVFYKNKEEEDFVEALKKLEHVNIIEEEEDKRLSLGNHFKLQSLLTNLFYPFFAGYLCIFKCISEICEDWCSEKTVFQKIQAEIENELLSGNLLHPYPLSIEVIASSLNSLQNLNALNKIKEGAEVMYKTDSVVISRIIQSFEPLVVRSLENLNAVKLNCRPIFTFSEKRAKL